MTLKLEDLSNFIGTTQWYKHSMIESIVYTDGVRYVAENGKAYWLVHEIMTSQLIKAVKAEQFQVWILVVQDYSGVLTCDDGNGNIVYKKEIHYTDFPLPEIKFYFVDNVLMLPGEY